MLKNKEQKELIFGSEETKIPKYYDGLDGLRTISALGIVSMHVLTNGDYIINGFLFDNVISSLGVLVYLFMMLSSFSMCCGYFDKILYNKITVQEFYGRRYSKVWPFFALLCVIDFIVSPSINSVYEVFANLTLCFGLLPNANISVIGVGWFLGTIFVFYIMFPFFCYLLSDKRRAWLSFMIAFLFNIICQIYFFDTNHGTTGGNTNIIYNAVFFIVGGLIFLYRDNLEKICKSKKILAHFICIIMITIYLCGFQNLMIKLIMFTAILVNAIGASRGILQNRVTKFCSGISMEIYLCHMFIFRIIEKIHIVHLFPSDILSYALVVVLTFIGAVVFSIAVNKILNIIRCIIKRVIKICT